MKKYSIVLFFITIASVILAAGCGTDNGDAMETAGISSDSAVTVTDGLGREVTVPFDPDHVICSGPGCLRLLTYLQAQDRVVAVDDMEGRRPQFDARPYALANPALRELPVFGEFRGHDNPELIVALEPQPQLIFKTYASMGMDPEELEEKTGIPVVVLNYGNLTSGREDLYNSLRTMAEVMDRTDRADDVMAFIDSTIEDLESRTGDILQDERPNCYVGGIAYRGPHGLQSTEPAYPPFVFSNTSHVALLEDVVFEAQEHADVAKEQIVAWDPDCIFIDLSTLQSDPEASALYQLRTDPAYAELQAVENGNVYGLMPYNWYTKNFGSILADAYFVGKTLYPERFQDIDPAMKANEIYNYLVGQGVFGQLKASFGGLVFERISI